MLEMPPRRRRRRIGGARGVVDAPSLGMRSATAREVGPSPGSRRLTFGAPLGPSMAYRNISAAIEGMDRPATPPHMTAASAHGDRRQISLPAPLHWSAPSTHRECTLHQLSPYIGKLKSTIASDLIRGYSEPGQLVVDTFCGSGTVALEAAILGRRVFASDASAYAITLTKGKLHAPHDLEIALSKLHDLLTLAESLPLPELVGVPKWVQNFFHPRTLQETIRIIALLRKKRHHFFLSSVLGILHHQRPGFLSYPSSHLVPYLRTKNFPRETHPDLYTYRDIRTRLRAKIVRAFERPPPTALREQVTTIRRSTVEHVSLPNHIDCVITSPPYMNALDYERDNRLRLWFLGSAQRASTDITLKSLRGFTRAIEALATQLVQKVKKGGYCVFVVGDRTTRAGGRIPSQELIRIFSVRAPSFRLCSITQDLIPDVRRSRKHVTGVKHENILVFRNSHL